MADMLAHVEEAANEGEALKEEGNGSEDMESVQHRLVRASASILPVLYAENLTFLIVSSHTLCNATE